MLPPCEGEERNDAVVSLRPHRMPGSARAHLEVPESESVSDREPYPAPAGKRLRARRVPLLDAGVKGPEGAHELRAGEVHEHQCVILRDHVLQHAGRNRACVH